MAQSAARGLDGGWGVGRSAGKPGLSSIVRDTLTSVYAARFMAHKHFGRWIVWTI